MGKKIEPRVLKMFSKLIEIVVVVKSLSYFRNSRRSRPSMEKEELRLLRKSLLYAYEHVPFYRDRFNKAGIHPKDVTCFDDMLKVPLTTKEDLHENNIDKLISDEYRKEDLIEGRTSGSSGKPTAVYFDKGAFFYLKIVSKFRGKSYCGLRLWDKVLVISDVSREIVQEGNRGWLAKLFSLHHS